MCTVSFFPKLNGDFILTSNRDESPTRKTLVPKKYKINDRILLYPKDEVAGGTWIGVSDNDRLICLLNGGFVTHVPAKQYRKSRGLIVTDLLTSSEVLNDIENYNFEDIEPFTVILVEFKNELTLYELVWDGLQKYLINKPLVPTIWSSSLLYTKNIKKQREEWFEDFSKKKDFLDQQSILNFHKTAGVGDTNSNLMMDRGFIKTKSITSVNRQNGDIKMRYEDLQSKELVTKEL